MQGSFHHMLMKTYFAFRRLVMTEAKKCGLTSGQPKVLEFLAENDGTDQTTIAAGCEIEPATVGNLLLRMEDAGLVERRRKDGNRRSLYVFLTKNGRRAAAQTDEIFRNAENLALASFSEDERRALARMLDELYRTVASREEKA